MRTRLKIPLLAATALILLLTAGFAIAQAIDQSESDEPPIDHADPDPGSDALEIGDAYTKAVESGDPEAIEKAARAVREEWFSRLGPDEKEGAEAASPEADVPADTYAFVNEAVTPIQVEQCRGRLDEGRPDPLCKLIVLYDEGQIEAGPYTEAEVDAILGVAETR